MINLHRAGQRCFELLALIGSPQLGRQDIAVMINLLNNDKLTIDKQ